ncbi:hypothetical protein HPP92_009797 [Vanilla planifolia]|uniref:Uncharacterized protein n=1 Tax=Vanilla planifolia TaxID=51239 RepID=A0A835RG23_VANPL|nr:hypothetical protein HPP92_009797 [Vanilla planifolia]
MQKAYWSTNCHKIGYAPRCNKRCIEAEDNDETSPKIPWLVSSLHPVKSVLTNKLSKDSGEFQGKYISRVSKKGKSISSTESSKGVRSSPMENGSKNVKEKPLKSTGSSCLGSHSMPSGSTVSDPDSQTKGEDVFSSIPNASALSKFSDKETSCLELQETFPNQQISGGTRSLTKEPIVMPLETIPDPEAYQLRISLLEDENEALKQRIKSMDETILLEKRKNKSLIDKVEDTEKKLEELNKEQEALIDIFAEERNRRDEEEANLRKRLKEAQDEIHDLLKLASNKCNSSSLS